jgi:hypothetical protein
MMTNTNRNRFYGNVFAIFACVMICCTVDAQYRIELSVYGGGGMSALQYTVNTGMLVPGYGGHLGAGYRYFLNESVGFVTGLEMAMYNNVFKPEQFVFNKSGNDGIYPFEFRSAGDVIEKQRAMMLQVPVMLQLQTKFDKAYNLYGTFGGKVGIPLFGTYNINAVYSNSGYYPFEDYTYTTQRFRGFGDYNEKLTNGSLEFNSIALFISAELGMKWNIRIRRTQQILYTGFYFDLGVSNIRKIDTDKLTPPDKLVVPDYVNNQFNLKVNSIFQEYYPGKVTPIAAGIKIQLAYGYESIHTEKAPKEKSVGVKRRIIRKRERHCDCCRICLFEKKYDDTYRRKYREFKVKSRNIKKTDK